MSSLALDSSTKSRRPSFRLARRTRDGAVALVCAPFCESLSHAEGDGDALGPCRAGPEPDRGLTGLGGAGGDEPPPRPERGAGDVFSSKPGSSSNRDLGVFSTVEPGVDPVPGRAGAVVDLA